MAAAVEGAQVDVDTALTIESRYFTYLATGQISKNMIGTFWHGLNAIKSGASRPKDVAKWKATKVGILGAGMMGAGIAYATASKGIPVILKDISIEAAEKGKAYSQKLLDKKASQGRLTAEKRDQVLSLITTTASAEDLQGCDLIIEAVFEIQNSKPRSPRKRKVIGNWGRDGIEYLYPANYRLAKLLKMIATSLVCTFSVPSIRCNW